MINLCLQLHDFFSAIIVHVNFIPYELTKRVFCCLSVYLHLSHLLVLYVNENINPCQDIDLLLTSFLCPLHENFMI